METIVTMKLVIGVYSNSNIGHKKTMMIYDNNNKFRVHTTGEFLLQNDLADCDGKCVKEKEYVSEHSIHRFRPPTAILLNLACIMTSPTAMLFASWGSLDVSSSHFSASVASVSLQKLLSRFSQAYSYFHRYS